MKLSEFDYPLPEALIAQDPLKSRDRARLMVINRKSGKIGHDIFANLGRYLPDQSVVVINNSKVIPARLLGRKKTTGAKFEIFLLKKLSDGCTYRVLMRPLKRVKIGDEITFGHDGLKARIVDIKNRLVKFNRRDVAGYLETIGHVPLPPYIKRPDREEDRTFYQTVYARHPGSVAAPTAGLHFTKELLAELSGAGHQIEKITLHVSAATFKPVQEEDIRDHQMHGEDFSISPATANRLRRAKDGDRRIVSVGTTSCRLLEAWAATGKFKGTTDLFIHPGFSFNMTDVLVTNFHLPRSTLLMLVYAFGGNELVRRAYQEAIDNEYRFFSYGDAMIIL